ncbi:MAG: VCBS repeat-containing protein [Candidatus Eisenbacteria bacterium]
MRQSAARFLLRLTCAIALLAPLQAHAFAGHDVLKGGPWWHEEISKRATKAAGFSDPSGAAIAWHSDYIDSYLYSPLWWARPDEGGGIQRFRYSMAQVPELIKMHFDDLVSAEDARVMWNRYLTGAFVGMQWAAERGDVNAAHNILGITLHSIEDFYSHSSWVNDPDRRERTWFETGAADRVSRVLYTGAYEHPESGQPHHGKLDIMCSLLAQPELKPLAEAMCNAISPMSNSSLCQQYKDCRDAVTVQMQVNDVVAPEGLVYLRPAGIALDNNFVAAVGVKERGLVRADGKLKDGKTDKSAGDELFDDAVTLATRSATQWLNELGAAMEASGQGAFWNRVKLGTEDISGPSKWAQFESFRNLPYQFMTAGIYPPDVAQKADRDQVYLRVRLKTADEAGAGTDADIVVKADGREYVLDYAPDAALPMRINDFEQGDDFSYTVGPFDRLPSSIVIENKAVTGADLNTALERDFSIMIESFGEGIKNAALALVSGEADKVAEAKYTFNLPMGGDAAASDAADWPAWAAAAPARLVAGDFDGDRKADMALLGGPGWNTIPVAFSRGDGTFRVTNIQNEFGVLLGVSPGANVVAGDFNGDGKCDLAAEGVAGWATSPVAFSNGDGTFRYTNAPIADFAVWASGAGAKLVAGDFNGDGRCDMALTGVAGWATLPVAFSNGDGSFRVTNAGVGDFAIWAAAGAKAVAGDFDGDGKADLALAGVSGWATQPIAFSNGDGGFRISNESLGDFPVWATGAGARLNAGDVNGDGKADLFLSSVSGWATFPLAISDGGGRFHTSNQPAGDYAIWAAAPGAQAVVGDWNGDGKADQALAGGPGWASWPAAFSNGDGSFRISNRPTGGGSNQNPTLSLDGQSEGLYNLNVNLRRVGGGPADAQHPAAWGRFQVTLQRLNCATESKWDRGSDSDEPFLIAALMPMPYGGPWGLRQGVVLGPWDDVDSGESRDINYAFGTVDLPDGYGRLALNVTQFESDDEPAADRDSLLAKAAPWLRQDHGDFPSTVDLLGRTLGAEWKVAEAEVYAFSRYPVVRGGTVANVSAVTTVASGSGMTLALDASRFRTFDGVAARFTAQVPASGGGDSPQQPVVTPPSGTPAPPPVVSGDDGARGGREGRGRGPGRRGRPDNGGPGPSSHDGGGAQPAVSADNTVLLQNAVTRRMLLSEDKPVRGEGAEGGWLQSPAVLEADANYYDLAVWRLEPAGEHFMIRNVKTGRLLFSQGEPVTTAGAEGGWLKAPRLLGADANYYDRALWQITRAGKGYMITNKFDHRVLFSVGEEVRQDGAEGGWLKSPAAVSADANYYDRAIWMLKGPGAKLVP